MADDAIQITATQRCDNLRWKGLFISADADPKDAHEFWCAKTQFGFGPDGKPVDYSECCAGRVCYREL